MKKIFFILKVGIISVVLYYLLLIFIIGPFVINAFLSQININETVFTYITRAIFILLFVAVCTGVAFLLKKQTYEVDSVHRDSDLPITPKPSPEITMWAVVLSIATIVVPQLPSDDLSQMVYLFTLPLLVICWIILSLLRLKYKNTANEHIRTAMYFLLTAWTLIISLIYQQLF